MAKKGARLRDALDRYQGKDHKLEKQKKLQKLAQKRKSARSKPEAHSEEDEDEIQAEHQGGVALNGALHQGSDEEEAGDSSEWESDDGSADDEEAEEQLRFDISRLNEIESDSDSASDAELEADDDDDDEDEDEDEDDEIPDLIPATGATTTSNRNGITDPADEQDIPLSDLSGASDQEDVIPHQRLTINNTAALQRALASFALPLHKLPFSEHQSITTSDPVQIPDVEDELNRELSFYSQALSSAKQARLLLRKEGTPFTRPNDYFAEMVKSDEHMGKIKSKLVDEAASRKASQDARKQRELKKFGKQVQMEKLKERAKQKKDMLDKVKILKRKRQSGGMGDANEDDMFDVALEDAATSERKAKDLKRAKISGKGKGAQQLPAKSAKRQKRDEKFGFGGKKRFTKSGDAASSADMTGFSTRRMKSQASGKKKGPAKRPGKSRRAKAN